MFMIVMLHVLGNGGVLRHANTGTFEYGLIWFLEIACCCAVNCYALISGYVGVYSKYKYSNIVLLWLRVAFYSVLLTLFCKVLFPNEIGLGKIAHSFFPVLSSSYWYFTSYFVLFLFMPILNIAVNQLSKKRLQLFLGAIIALFCCIRPFALLLWEDAFSLGRGYNPWWLIILYLCGGYIRKYSLFSDMKKTTLLVLFFVSSTFLWLIRYIIQLFSGTFFDNIDFDKIFVSYISLTALGSAVFLFLFFERLRFNKTVIRIVSFLSPLAFSVYLIHNHPLINKFFINDSFYWILNTSVYYMIPLLFGIVLSIYIVCLAIDALRHYLFKIIKLKDKLNRLEIKLSKKLL